MSLLVREENVANFLKSTETKKKHCVNRQKSEGMLKQQNVVTTRVLLAEHIDLFYLTIKISNCYYRKRDNQISLSNEGTLSFL